jgi:hypothetical protein
MASSENDRHQDGSADRQRAARNRKIEPPRKAPQTERGLTHSPYFNDAYAVHEAYAVHGTVVRLPVVRLAPSFASEPLHHPRRAPGSLNKELEFGSANRSASF